MTRRFPYARRTGCINRYAAMSWRRAQIQDTFIEQYHCPVISFCINIPGPVKTNEQIRTAFDSGKNTLLLKLEQAETDIKNSIEIHEKTGDELLLAIDCPAEKSKISQLRLKKHIRLGVSLI